MSPLLTVDVVQPRIVVVHHGLLLPQDQKEEEEMILDQSRGLRVGEWTEIDPHRLLVVDETDLITTIDMRTAVNENEIKIEIGVLLRVGRLRLRLLVWRDRGTGLHRCLSRDVMRPCMRDENKMYVVEEEVGLGVE
jgi:hypothetical protein